MELDPLLRVLRHVREDPVGVRDAIVRDAVAAHDQARDHVRPSFVPEDAHALRVALDSLLVLMRNGHAYVNVHTVAHPGGEIRGQVVKQ